MKTFVTDNGEHIIVRLDRGDFVLESIEQTCDTYNIKTGAVVSAIGTLRNLNIHYLHSDDLSQMDSRNTFLELDGCWEISGIQGLIADGEPHLHVSAYNGDQTIVGHLEEGNEVNALAELLIRKLDSPELMRRPNEYKVSMLEYR